VRARANNKEWWPIPIDQVWDIFVEVHAKVVDVYHFQSHALTLMANHYHWALSTPEGNLDEGMRYFQTMTSKKISKAAGRINRIYGGRYGWTVLTSPDSFQKTYRYIYMNPVRANICANPLHYSWSTLVNRGLETVSALGFAEGIPVPIQAQAQWMLEMRSIDDELRIQKALRRRVFTMPRPVSGYR
jgi:hypothetical protein